MAGASTGDSISCAINAEISQTLAAIRLPPDPILEPDSRLLHSLLSLRSFLFHPLRATWPSVDPAIYLSPFLTIIQNDNISAAATAIAFRALRKIIAFNIFDAQTPGAREAIQAVVAGITNCHVEMTDDAMEELVLMRVVKLLKAVVKCKAFVLLDDAAICSIVSANYDIVQQAVGFSAALRSCAREGMQGIIERVCWERSGGRCVVDVFCFLVRVVNEEEMLFGLLMIKGVLEIGGEGLDCCGGILGVVQDELFGRLVYYGTRCGVAVLSLICDVVFNLYCFARR